MWCVVDGCRLVVVDNFFRFIGLGYFVSVLSSDIMCLMIWIEICFVLFVVFFFMVWFGVL